MRGEIVFILSALALSSAAYVRFDRGDPSQADEICAAATTDDVLVAHEHCNKFYKCDHGKPVAFDCYGTLQFCIETDKCEWPYTVDCGNRIVPDDGSGSDEDPADGQPDPEPEPEPESESEQNISEDNDSNGESDNGNTGGGNCDPNEAPAICAADGSDGVLVAHENCNKFYVCGNGLPVGIRCPGDLLFNPNLDICDWPDNVDCGDRVIPIPQSGENSGSDNGSSDEDDSDNGGGCGCNDNPSEAPAICAADGSDSVLVAHESCNKYYICAQGEPLARRCPGTLLYNPKLEVCDWPENVDCGDRVIPEPEGGDNGGGDNGGGDNGNGGEDDNNSSGGSDNGNTGGGNCDPNEAPAICAADGSDGVLVAHENCNKFYVCANGLPVGIRCPGNLLFNPWTDQCDWPDNVECGDRVIPEPDSGDNGNGGGDDNGNGGGDDNGNGGEDNGNGGGCGCNDNPSEAPEICAAEGSDSVLVAHEKCNKYYVCAHGQPIAQRCPGTLLYNPSTEQCDWPDNVQCGDRVIPEPEGGDNGGGDNGGGDNENGGEDDNNSSGGSDNGNTGGGNCDPNEAPAICAADGSDGVLVAHEKCNKFYVCANGLPVGIRCPGNLLFNPWTDQCDWPHNVECGDRVIPEPDSGDNGNGGGDDNGNGGGDDNGNGGEDNGNGGGCGCNDNPSEAPEICAAEGSDSVLVAHEKCNKYYVCAHGQPIAQRCPGTLLYNPSTEQCDWPDNVQCGDRVIPEPEGGDNGGGDNGGGDNGGGDNGNGGEDDNNSSGGSDNGNTGGGNCDPNEAPAICAADGSDGVLVAHEKCNKFYVCANGLPVGIRCPGNLLFNPWTDQCDWPDNVECGDRVIPEPDSGDNGNGGGDDNGNGGGDDNGNGGEDNGNGGGCGCNDNPSEAPEICAAEGSDSVLVAHEKCNKYYVCAHGQPIAQRCPGTLLYNPSTEQCDWPDNVQCGDRVIPEPEGGDNGGGDNGGGDNGNGGEDDNNSSGGSDNGNTGGGNCDPNEAPAICAADGSDGVLVAHEKCNKFYVCANGLPVGIRCPGNLLFNPWTDQCDWPDNVECGDRVIPEPDSGDNGNGGGDDNGNGGGDDNDNGGEDNGNGGGCGCNDNPSEAPEICAAEGSDSVLVAHEKCNKYYVCAHGQPIAQRCPGTLLYNPSTEQCDWPDNVQCGDRVIPEPEGGDNGGGDNGGGDNGNGGEDDNNSSGGSDNGNTGGGNCDPNEAPAICAADGSDGVLVAHEKCNKFYVCANGLPVGIRCPGNLLFNPWTDQCDWPDNVECGDRVIPEPDSGDNGNGGGDDNGNGGGDDNGNGGEDNGNGGGCGCNDNPSEAPSICAADGSDGVFVAHEQCNKFYTCVHGLPVTLRCPGILLYNPLLERCDWPDLVTCGDRVIPDPDTEEDGDDNNGNGDNGDNGNGDGGNGGNCDPSEAPAICAADGSDGVLVAHENCNQFYKCANGLPASISCPGNLLYNPILEYCDWPENVDCGDRVIPEENTSGEDDNNTDNSPEDNGNGCGCNDNPSEAPAICAVEGSDNVLVAHESCNYFYVCASGNPVALRCPTGTLYDPATERCDWADNVQCGNRGIPEDEDCDDASNGGGDDSAVEENDSGSQDNNSDNEESDEESPPSPGNPGNPGEEGPMCSSALDFIYFAHANCNQFYVCIAGKAHELTCPSITLYDVVSHECLWPQYVDCGTRVLP